MGDETCAEIGPLLPPTEPVVVLKRPDRRPSGRCFTAFRRRVIDQESPAKVAEELGVKQRRLRAMVSRVTNWAAQHEQVGNVLAIKIQHTAMLYELWRDARAQYKRSCEEATSHNVTSVKSTGPNGTTEKTTTKVSRRGQSGNPRYLEIADNLLASIRGIWGADAPKQIAMPDTPGGTVALAVLLNASSGTPKPPREDRPQPNVIDVDAEIASLDAPGAE